MEALTTAWMTSVAASPVAGAAGMILLIVGLNFLRGWLPWLQPAGSGGSAQAPEPDTSRVWQAAVGDVAQAGDDIAGALKLQCELVRRQAEALERLERTIAVLVAQERGRDGGRPRQGPPR